MTQSNSQNAIKAIYPHELVEHRSEHYRRNRELNPFCYGPISKYGGNSNGCIRYYPVWTDSHSWVPRHKSLHISITGDEVRARVAAFLQRFLFQTVLNLHLYPGVTVYRRLMIFSRTNAKTSSWKNSYGYIETKYLLWHCTKNSDYFWTWVYPFSYLNDTEYGPFFNCVVF